MTRGKKSFIHRANKNRSGNSDSGKLDILQTHLQNLGYHTIRETIISNGNFITRNHIRVPDIKVVKGKFEIYLELDGYGAHGDLITPNEKTIRRNTDYEVSHYNYIILNEADAKIDNLDIQDLAAYRIREEYSKHLAKIAGGCMFV